MKGATSIQERLWELRKDKGLNLEELSELTGISKSALGSYEKEDYKEINHGNLITLADKALHARADDSRRRHGHGCADRENSHALRRKLRCQPLF